MQFQSHLHTPDNDTYISDHQTLICTCLTAAEISVNTKHAVADSHYLNQLTNLTVTFTLIRMHTHTHTHTQIHIYIYKFNPNKNMESSVQLEIKLWPGLLRY
jgi:hypothetical protein